MEQSFRNHLLIALPGLKGDYFAKSVSLLIDHNEEGAFGLMINRLTETVIGEVFPELAGKYDCPVLEGGPVEQNRVFFLHETSAQTFESSFTVGDDVWLTSSPDFVEAMLNGQAPERTLAVLGYAGWGSQQLEEEIGDNCWLLAPSSADIVFDVPFEARARTAASRLGVDLNLMHSAGYD